MQLIYIEQQWVRVNEQAGTAKRLSNDTHRDGDYLAVGLRGKGRWGEE